MVVPSTAEGLTATINALWSLEREDVSFHTFALPRNAVCGLR
jgi:hypothetical protein